jgi:hypothetical protein
MKVKELIEFLQTKDENLDVFLYHEKEINIPIKLGSIETINKHEDMLSDEESLPETWVELVG